MCHRRKILPWLLQPNHWYPHWEKEMTAVTQSFCKTGQSLILFLSAPVCVCVYASTQKSPVGLNTLCCFLFFSGWVPDGHVTPEHMYSGQTSGTALPTESILWSPGGAEKSCTCSSLLHGEGNLSVTCHRSSKLISAAETLLTSTCANGEWHG